MILLILHWFIHAYCDSFLSIHMIHSRRITLPWACIKQTRGLLPLAAASIGPGSLSSDWPRGVTLPYWGPEPTSNQIQTSVPSREESGGSASAFSTVTLLYERQTNNACRSVRRDFTDLVVIIVGSCFYSAGCFSSSQWQHCRCFWWPCRPHLSWPSPLCIGESNLKTGVRSFSLNYTFIISLCCCDLFKL